MAAVASIQPEKDSRSGTLGTIIPGKTTIAGFDLVEGDTLYYEYQANSPCWFVITTDWLNLDTAALVNLSEASGKGSLDCQEDGRYILIVFFLDFPQGFEATVDFEFYKLDDQAPQILVVKPILLSALTVALTSMVSVTHRRTRATSSDGRSKATGSYWDYFASETVNWIAIVIGACLLVADSVIDLAYRTTEMPEFVSDWLLNIGFNFLAFGLFFGLAITWPKYR